MAYPPKRETNFEKVVIGEFINGVIDEIEYDNEHKFSFKGKETIAPAVRIKFKLEGYKYHHSSRWMRFNVGEKSNLFKNYISKLVKNARPEMYFDLDELKGMAVKTLWAENNDFQNIESVFPVGEKRTVSEAEEGTAPEPQEAPEPNEDEVGPEPTHWG